MSMSLSDRMACAACMSPCACRVEVSLRQLLFTKNGMSIACATPLQFLSSPLSAVRSIRSSLSLICDLTSHLSSVSNSAPQAALGRHHVLSPDGPTKYGCPLPGSVNSRQPAGKPRGCQTPGGSATSASRAAGWPASAAAADAAAAPCPESTLCRKAASGSAPLSAAGGLRPPSIWFRMSSSRLASLAA